METNSLYYFRQRIKAEKECHDSWINVQLAKIFSLDEGTDLKNIFTLDKCFIFLFASMRIVGVFQRVGNPPSAITSYILFIFSTVINLNFNSLIHEKISNFVIKLHFTSLSNFKKKIMFKTCHCNTCQLLGKLRATYDILFRYNF